MAEFLKKAFAISLTIYCFPLMFLILVILFIVQGRPLFFSQIRMGKGFKEFLFYKFRTMDNSNDGSLVTISGDKRITQIGRLLRRYKIDELPQLLNIIKGDIVFVGPRAEVKKYVNRGNFSFLEQVKPGITDFSSIILRDEENVLGRLEGDYKYENLLPLKLKLVRIYVNNKSLFLDIEIVLITIISIFFPYRAKMMIMKKYIKKNDNNLYVSLMQILC